MIGNPQGTSTIPTLYNAQMSAPASRRALLGLCLALLSWGVVGCSSALTPLPSVARQEARELGMTACEVIFHTDGALSCGENRLSAPHLRPHSVPVIPPLAEPPEALVAEAQSPSTPVDGSVIADMYFYDDSDCR